MNKVLYLCYNNQIKNVGFVFPDELEENIYSPGFFTIQARGKNIKLNQRFFSKYLFLTVEKGNIIKNILTYKKDNIFSVKTEKYGEIQFEALHVPNYINKYVGENKDLKNKNNNFYILKCTNSDFLEIICKEEDFYFIGSVKVKIKEDEKKQLLAIY